GERQLVSPTGDTSTDLTLVGLLAVLIGLAARVVALGVIPGGRRPSTGMAWLLLVLLSPFLCLVAFWFFGSNHVGKARRRRQLQLNERIRSVTEALPEASGSLRPDVLGVTRLNRNLTGLPATPGNAVTVLADYRGSIWEMTAAI